MDFQTEIDEIRNKIAELNREIIRQTPDTTTTAEEKLSKKKVSESDPLKNQINTMYMRLKMDDYKKGKNPQFSISLRKEANMLYPGCEYTALWLSIPTEEQKEHLKCFLNNSNKYSSFQLEDLSAKLVELKDSQKHVMWDGYRIVDLVGLDFIYDPDRDIFTYTVNGESITTTTEETTTEKGVKNKKKRSVSSTKENNGGAKKSKNKTINRLMPSITKLQACSRVEEIVSEPEEEIQETPEKQEKEN